MGRAPMPLQKGTQAARPLLACLIKLENEQEEKDRDNSSMSSMIDDLKLYHFFFLGIWMLHLIFAVVWLIAFIVGGLVKSQKTNY